MPPSNAHNYREHLYRARAHPKKPVPTAFIDRRDSFGRVYFSIIPFLALEYLSEARYEFFPSGLVFPTAFLLYWAFYYTYYRPGLLENKLSALPHKKDVMMLPALFLGVVIWFVKVTVVEVGHLLFFRWFVGEKSKGAPKASASGQSRNRGYQYQQQRTRPRSNPNSSQGSGSSQRASSNPPPLLPADVRDALAILGLGECRDWHEIHHRYRELAKKYHPDLNGEVTLVGNRFMRVDAAYRKLLGVKSKYFA